MKNTFVGLGLAIFLAVASSVGAQASFEPLPPPPAFDGAPIASDKPMDAAIKAIGPLADQFVDRSINSPFFVGPQDVWVAKFLTTPRMLRPGLCVERMLIVPLRLARIPTGLATWQAHNVHWTDQMRAVGRFSAPKEPAQDSKALADCLDLTLFKPVTTYGLLESGSVDEAWQAGLVLEGLAAAAQARAKLPFLLSCQPIEDKKLCGAPRRTLAGLTVAKLWNAKPCDKASAGCIRLDVTAPGGFGEDYWELTVKLADAHPVQPTDVSIQYVTPPVV